MTKASFSSTVIEYLKDKTLLSLAYENILT